MMKNKYYTLRLRSAQVLLLVLTGFFYSCEKTKPTIDEIEYSADRTKAPIINKDSDVTSVPVFVGDTYVWEIDIEAYNGIDSIFLDGEFKESYGNGQLKLAVQYPVSMPNQDSYQVSLMVKDEIGLETTKKLTLTRQAYKSPYIIADFPYGGADVMFLPQNHARRVKFPQYSASMPDYQNKNFAWADAKITSDMPVNRIRFGSPGFNGSGSGATAGSPNIAIADWQKLVGFGETSALRLNLHPRKGNLRTMIALDEPINQYLIEDVVDKKIRVIKIDVFVDTDPVHPYATSSWSGNLKPYGTVASNTYHTTVGLGLANTVKFNDRGAPTPKTGQDYGMITAMLKKDEWETLTFVYNPADKEQAQTKGKVFTTADVDNDEVDMLILVVSPAGATNTSSATYYFRNLRIEEIPTP